jgi:hypothetical protein
VVIDAVIDAVNGTVPNFRTSGRRIRGGRVQRMRRHALSATALFLSALTLACGSDETPAEREWAEQATLQVARVNDVVALEMLPALVPGVDDQPVTVMDGTLDPDWPKLEAACGHLSEVLPEVLEVAADTPRGLGGAGKELAKYHDALQRVVDGCRRATPERDLEQLKSINTDFQRAGTHASKLAEQLPSDIECPAQVQDRPETCDA